MAVAVQARAATNERLLRWGLVALSAVALAGAWEIAGRLVDDLFLASFTATMARLVELTASGELVRALLTSGYGFVVGMAISVAVGVPFALLLARVDPLREALEPYLFALYATPMAVFIPFVLAILGIGFTSRLIVIVAHAIFPIILNTLAGARGTPRELLDVARSFGAGEREIWRDVVLPHTVPHAMSGIRQGIARGLIGMIAAEFFLTATGLGRLLIGGAMRFDSATVLGTTLVLTIVAVVLIQLGQWLEGLFTTWRQEQAA